MFGGCPRQKLSKERQEQARNRMGHATASTQKKQFDEFDDFGVPEIQKSNFSYVLLHLISMGISDVDAFDFIDKPPDEIVDAALEQLTLLGAIDVSENGEMHITDLGKQMVRFPVDLRFSKMIVTSQKYQCTDEILTIISFLLVEPVFLDTAHLMPKYHWFKDRYSKGEGDHVMLLNICKDFRHAISQDGWSLMHYMSYKGMAKAICIRRQLGQMCEKLGIEPCSCGEDTVPLRKCLLSGLFLNSAYLHKRSAYKTIMSNEEVFVHSSSSLYRKKPTYCIYTDIVKTSKFRMRNVSVIDVEWLPEVAPEYYKKYCFKL